MAGCSFFITSGFKEKLKLEMHQVELILLGDIPCYFSWCNIHLIKWVGNKASVSMGNKLQSCLPSMERYVYQHTEELSSEAASSSICCQAEQKILRLLLSIFTVYRLWQLDIKVVSNVVIWTFSAKNFSINIGLFPFSLKVNCWILFSSASKVSFNIFYRLQVPQNNVSFL